MNTDRRPRLLETLTVAPVVALSCGLLLLAGCSSTASTATPDARPSAGARNGGGSARGMGANDPGRVSGEIAAVDGKTLQVQGEDSQTAVTYTSKTTFTAQVAGTVSDLAKGDCVVVFSSSAGQDATEVTATSVTSSVAAADGTCTSGFGGGGTRPSGAPSGMPSGAAPSGGPSGMPNGGARPQSGEVTVVDGDTLTVAVKQQGSNGTTPLTVKTTSDTTVTVAEKSKSSAAKVGVCATANGEADDTGMITAKTITLRKAGDDGCSMRQGNR